MVFAVTSIMTVNRLLPSLIHEFRVRGWEVHVISSPGEADRGICDGGVFLHQVKMHRGISPLRDLVAVLKTRRTLVSIQPKLVVGSTPKAGLVSMLAARLAGVPVRVLQFRGAWWDSKSGIAARAAIRADHIAGRSATYVMANSHSLADLLLTAKVFEHPVDVLGEGGFRGVNLEIFCPAQPGPRSGNQVIGFAGRLNADKGLDDLFDVVAELRRSSKDITLQIVGGLDDAHPLAPEVVDRLRRMDGVEWLGPREPEELAAIMRNWDVLLFPSLREGMPNVVLEAAACGIPSVGWEVTGVKDAIVDGVTGFVVPRGNRQLMAERVRSLLSSDLGVTMGVAARERIERDFAFPQLERRIVDHLEGLV